MALSPSCLVLHWGTKNDDKGVLLSPWKPQVTTFLLAPSLILISAERIVEGKWVRCSQVWVLDPAPHTCLWASSLYLLRQDSGFPTHARKSPFLCLKSDSESLVEGQLSTGRSGRGYSTCLLCQTLRPETLRPLCQDPHTDPAMEHIHFVVNLSHQELLALILHPVPQSVSGSQS